MRTIAFVLVLAAGLAATQGSRRPAAFTVVEATIAEMQAAMRAGARDVALRSSPSI